MTSKFFQMPAAVPCPSMPGWLFSPAAGDVDGDGRQEIVALASGQNSLFFVTLSQLKRGELTPLWRGADQDAWGQLVIMDARIGALGQWEFSLGDTFVMADLDNDGADEIFVFDHASWVGVFKWQLSGAGGTQSWAQSLVFIQNGTITGPAGTWSIGSNDRFFAADVDGDGQQEIVVFDGQSKVGVMKWQQSALALIGLTAGQMPSASGGTSWVMSAGDKFAAARLGGAERIFVFDSHSWISVLTWGTSGLEVLWILDGTISGPPRTQWTLSPNDQFFPADLDGDGDQELFVYDGSSYVGVLKWQGAAMQTIWLTNQPFSSQLGGWTIVPGNRFYVMPATSAALIEVYDGAQKLGTLGWLNGALHLDGVINTELNGPNGLAWELAQGAGFVVADLDGDGIPEMLGYDGSGSVAVIVDGQVVVWTAAGQLPVWNLAFILASPATPLAPFSGNQSAVYAYMSNAVYADSDGDIRSEYTNTNIPDGNFQSYSAQLADMPYPSGQGFSDADWSAVQAVLVPELQNVGPLRGMFGNMNQLALDIKAQQDNDLATAVQNVSQDVTDDTVSYWTGQVVDAAIWGAAVIPEAKVGQLALAVTASLFGGSLGSSGPPQQVSYSDFTGAVDAIYLNAISQNGTNETTALQDAGMIAVAGQLAGQAWEWLPTESADIALSSTNANRLMFYQILIPVKFKIIQFLNNPFDYPYGDAQREAPWSYWSQANGDGTYNVYMLGYDDTLFHPYGFASQNLMNDLFENLGVVQSEFFLSQGPWSVIPQVSSNS